jgi:hypothetical protein
MGINFSKITGDIKKVIPKAPKTNKAQMEEIAQNMAEQSMAFKKAERADTFQKLDQLLASQKKASQLKNSAAEASTRGGNASAAGRQNFNPANTERSLEKQKWPSSARQEH